jgi:hypothetical protein
LQGLCTVAAIETSDFAVKLAANMTLAVCLAAMALAESATDTFRAAQHAEKQGDRVQALILYTKAAALEPANAAYAAKRIAMQASVSGTLRTELEPEPPAGIESDVPEVLPEPLDIREIMQARQALSPPRLQGSTDPKSFNLTGDVRMIFEKVAGAYGIQVVFESDYQAPPPFTFRIDAMNWDHAFRILEMVSNSFLVPVNPHLALVVRDTPQKRAERAPAVATGIPIPERMTVQDAQELVQAVQQTLEIRRVSVDPGRRMVYMRDQAAKILIAQQLFASLSRLRPQVELEVEFVSVIKNSSLGYGLSLPNSFPLVDFGSVFRSKPNLPSGFTRFLAFGGGASFLGLGITDSTLMATLTKSETTTVLKSQIVAVDGQAASLHVGDRYPILASGYFGNTTGTGQVFSPPPTVNFEDLGLVLKITPTIHADHEVTLDIDSEFKVLGNTSLNGIPTISNRKYVGKVRLAANESAVIAGLVGVDESDTKNGVAGLSEIPAIGRLFSSNTKTSDSTQVLLIIRPHLTSLAPWDYAPPALLVGTETKPISLF